MPHDLVLKGMNGIHRTLIAVSGGRLGWDAGGMPALELTTTGRRSAMPRSVMLTSPLQEDDAIVVVASRGGDDHHPAWYHNVLADPSVTVSWKGGPSRPMTARVADADERARMWPIITADHRNYAGYQAKTEREIPLVILEPSD